MRRYLWLILGLLLGMAIFIIPLLTRPYSFHGSVIEPAPIAPEIRLTNQFGQIFNLSAQTSQINLIFFGYTSCPDVCPATLSSFKKINQDLGDLSTRVNFILVTVDPSRDSPEKLKPYLAAFDPAFIGLTGNLEDLQMIWQAYGVFREEQPVGDSGNYLVSHSSRVYLVDQSGKLLITYPFETNPSDIQQDIRFLLEKSRG